MEFTRKGAFPRFPTPMVWILIPKALAVCAACKGAKFPALLRPSVKRIIILDIPLLIENKINKKSDILVFVDAKKKEINKRLKKRSNFNPKIVGKLKKLQLPLEMKKRRSDFIIKNNFKNNFVKKNVKRLKEKILLNA